MRSDATLARGPRPAARLERTRRPRYDDWMKSVVIRLLALSLAAIVVSLPGAAWTQT
jgi:hypothetical protein